MTAFIDLLGLSNALSALDRIVDENLSGDAADRIVEDSVVQVLQFRDELTHYFRILKESRMPSPPGLAPELLDSWRRSHDYEARLALFSDCAVINLFIDDKNPLGTTRAMIDIFFMLSFAYLSIMAKGQLVRGGIDTGVTMDHGEAEVLGSGLVHSHRLESCVAGYPRIVVGPRLMGYLAAMEQEANLRSFGIIPEEIQLIRVNVAAIRNQMVADSDGLFRISQAHPWVLHGLDAFEGQDLVEEAINAITTKLANPEIVRSPDHFKKLSWARNMLLDLGRWQRSNRRSLVPDGTHRQDQGPT